MGFEIYDLSLKYTGNEDSNVNVQSKIIINNELKVVVGTVTGIISTFFLKGHVFSNILDNTPLCWLNLNQIYLVPNYGDPFLWGGLTPAYSPESCPNGLPYGDQTKMLLHPKELIAQIVQNIVDSIHGDLYIDRDGDL